MDNELKVKITGDVSDLKTALGQGENSIDSFGKSTKKAEKETDSLKGGTEKLGKQLKNLTGEAQSAEGAICDMAEGLGEGGLIGIGTAIIGTLGLLIAKVKSVQQEFGALAEAQSKAVGAAQAEISTLQALISVANDETRSRQERERALGQINAQYGDYLGNLSLEELATEKVIKQVNLLTESLVRQAKIKGAQDLIAKESAELFEILAKGPIGAADNIDILQAALASAGNATSFTTNLVKQGLSTQGKAVEEADKKIKAYQETLNALLGEDITAGGLSTKEGDAETKKSAEKAAKDRAKAYEDSLKAYEKAVKTIDKDLESFLLENAKEDGYQAALIYEESGARIAAALKDIEQDPLELGVDEAYLKILKLEESLKRLKGQVSDEQFKIISSYDLEQLTAFENKLKATKTVSEAFSAGVGSAFSTLSGQLASSLQTGNAILDSFVGAFINSLSQVAAAMLQQAIIDKIFSAKKVGTNLVQSSANAITIATSAASALGPYGAIALPGLIASQLAIVGGAFAGITAGAAAFASGGIVPGGSFNGDGIPALLNSGEMVLNARQQSNLFSQLNRSGGQSAMDRAALEVFGVIRGQDILLSSTRAARNNNRFSS